MHSLHGPFAPSSPPDSPAALLEVTEAALKCHTAPVISNVRRALAAAADAATLRGQDPRPVLRQGRDALISAVDDVLLDELARWASGGGRAT